MIIDYEDDKENMPNESDYEDLPSMYKDEEDDVDDEDEDDDDDDSIFTSERLQLRRKLHRFGNMEGLNVSTESYNLLSRNFLLCLFVFLGVFYDAEEKKNQNLYLGRRTVCLSAR